MAKDCLVDYTSGVQYSAKANELQALAYAIGALTGCGMAGTTNDLSGYKVNLNI